MVEDMNADFSDGYCRLPLSATLASRVSAVERSSDPAWWRCSALASGVAVRKKK